VTLADLSNIRDVAWIVMFIACILFVPIKLANWTWINNDAGSDGDSGDGSGD
jgi:hypothetical protein